jgi:hypothetical protein
MKRPSPAIVISLVALFTSMSGTSLAVTRYIITRESQIAPSVLKKLEARAAAVERPAPADPASAAIPGPRGERGPEGAASTVAGPRGEASTVPGPKGESIVGPAGPRGESVIGPEGKEGKQGVAGTIAVTLASTTYKTTEGEDDYLPAQCAEGQIAVGGGYELRSGDPEDVMGSWPDTPEGPGPRNWYVRWQGGPAGEVRVIAECATP